MGDDLPRDYLEQIRGEIVDARKRFASDAAPLLQGQRADVWRFAESLEKAIGEISPADALDALRQHINRAP